ncbi:MAG: hypothetical protein AB7O52_18785 [Planctomycetota bacterium]
MATERSLCRLLLAALLGVWCSSLVGCVHGFIYEHTTVPLTRDFQRTPVVSRSAQSDVKRLEVYRANFVWDSNGIGDIAKQHGLETVYYADLETVNVLGIWNQFKVIVYGK